MIEIGRVCYKIAGREAGRYCVVVKVIDKNFAIVTGPKQLTGVKRRKVNLMHIEPLEYKLNIKEDASDQEVLQAWKKSKLASKLGLKLKPKKKKEEKQPTKKPAKK